MEFEIDPESGLVRWHPRPLPRPPHSIAAVLEPILAADGARLALIDGDRRWTYQQLDAAIEAMTRRLSGAGLGVGDRLLWSSPNCAELIIAFLASQRLGAIWVALSPNAPESEKARVIELLDPRVALLGLDSLGDLDDLEDDAPDDARPDIDPLAPAAIGFTSGTTGPPKAVVHSQHGLLVPAQVSHAVEPPEAVERIGTPLALTTLNMLVLGPLSAFVRGTTAVLMTRTDSRGFSDQVERHRVTRAFVVPTILHDLVNDETATADQLGSLDRVVAGAAGTRPGLLEAFTERFGVRPTLSYGLSEAPTGIVRESLADPIGSRRGFPLPHVSIAVVDGEIVVSATPAGPWADVWTPMLGYWLDRAATEAALHAGLLHTGDFGTIDSEGGVQVRGRIGSIINRGGELIAPREVEAALELLPEIDAAAVVGLPEPRLGEVVAALVVPSPGAEMPELDEVLPRSRVPAVVIVVDALPLTPLGKVDLAEVRRVLGG